ncbi:DUF3103 family protein [Streptomyces sp. HB2AG]|uniref:DUF3103 family protein n=1 Tax=Streptomyces sp. HB2AG TaxID=2983400 RepID=UPI0022A9F884|nr:DUF3103 family protein [Streptomyces sp. HB2AG]MCZ2526267.1 DUF3103 family protein [Streptomyces sp. HB2AG]
MSGTKLLRTALTGIVLSATALTTLQGTALAADAAKAPKAQPAAAAPAASTVGGIEAETARALAESLTDAAWRNRVRNAALASEEVDLQALTAAAPAGAGRELKAEVADADVRIAEAKGLGSDIGSLLRVRLADASMREDLTARTAPLVAAAPADDDASTITAYDSRGTAHELDADTVPERPVYIVGVDGAKAVRAGLEVLNEELDRQGLASPARQTDAKSDSRTLADIGTNSTGFWTTKITSVSVGDLKEPWFKGDAEVFTLVTGFGKDGVPRVDPVQMPYLDSENTTYYPNQVLVNWSNYKYNLADAVMMEDDGDTNYQSLAKAIAAVLLTITDQGMYIPLVDALLDAVPTSWWTDDPDYVDSWYTLAKEYTGRRNGAAANGWMNVQPYWVSAL